jgi:hypothetical protein
VTVSGEQVAKALSLDVEECAEALVALAEEMSNGDLLELSDYLKDKSDADRDMVKKLAFRIMEMCSNEASDT